MSKNMDLQHGSACRANPGMPKCVRKSESFFQEQRDRRANWVQRNQFVAVQCTLYVEYIVIFFKMR